MTTLTIDLPPDLYRRLRAEASQQDKPVETVARDLLAERLLPEAAPDSIRGTLRQAGLLVEFTQAEIADAEADTTTLEDVSNALAQNDGPMLSEIIIEQRGPLV